MHALFTAVLAIAGTALAAPAVEERQTHKFRLRATDKLAGWALKNAHVEAGRNVIQIQRPSVYSSDPSYLNGTHLYFDLGTTPPYGVSIPEVPAGTVAQVSSQPGEKTPGFSVGPDGLLTFNSVSTGFWACPVNNVFELFYGGNPDPAKLPSKDCLAIQLSVGII
ncbi:hypothetical protein Daesc_000086 [Daldinia eschscholtzii]|uniref:DUF7907 domain-containing protein n=1 Tax=Daldinia eschscholtzii TaxID=292717 RepID=A0AAX6MXS4_9PEZI